MIRSRRAPAVLLAVAVVAAAAGLAAQAPATPDAARAAWRYRRAVTLPAAAASGGRFAAIALPPDVAEHSQPDLRDLRLVGDDGREVPFVLDVDAPRIFELSTSGRLVEAQEVRRRHSSWIVEFPGRLTFDNLQLEVDGAGFSKRVELETSPDGHTWTRVEGDAWIFDRPWRGRQVRDTTIERPTPLETRFVRITLDDFRSTPVALRQVWAVRRSLLGGSRWTRDAQLERIETPPGQPSRYRVAGTGTGRVERLTIDADDAAFWRDVRVFEEQRGALTEIAGQIAIYRMRLDDAALNAERLDVDLQLGPAGPLVVEIDDGDSPPLQRPRVTLSGAARRILVPPSAAGLTLYYGNTATRRPIYDLEGLRLRLAQAETFPEAALGPEVVNPRFAPPPPMAFLAMRGAVAETTQWAVARPVRIAGREDVYTLTMPAADLAYLRPDLGDLRLVDAERRQVPYVLEPRAVAARVGLAIGRGTPRANTPQTSAWTLKAPEPPAADRARGLPLARLDLLFADAFFTRPAFVLVPDSRAAHGRRVIVQDAFRASRRDAAAPPEPQAVELGDLRANELAVEVRDGDNAPLQLTKAEAVVLVPRLTFKAGPGTYRLLFGNPAAAAPTYDVAALRQDMLAYSAVPLEAAALDAPAANPDYTRTAGDYVDDVLSGPLFWTVLVVSIAALLWVVAYTIRQPQAPRAS
jgi:hypothetical protein